MAEDGVTDTPDDDAAAPDEAAEPRELAYGSVIEFVREYLCHVYRRRIDGQPWIWVGDWWRYPEAEDVLDALWRAWEHLSLDGKTGRSVWWRDHARPHMESLMTATTTPFPIAAVEQYATTGTEPLPHVEPPAGSYPDQRGPAAVATAVLNLMAKPDAAEYDTRLRGYLTAELAADPDAIAALEIPDGPVTSTPEVTENGENDVAVIAGELIVLLTRSGPAEPWLVRSIRIL